MILRRILYLKRHNLDTPLLLEYSTYDDIYGLSLNALSKNKIHMKKKLIRYLSIE